MRLLVYSAKEFEIPFLELANNGRHQVHYLEELCIHNLGRQNFNWIPAYGKTGPIVANPIQNRFPGHL